MKAQPPVSIIINNYNYDRFLAEAIDSALGQSYPNLETIVVDDGSTDNSRDVILGYKDRVTAVFKENGGQASPLSAGFAASKGKAILLLDADDLFLRNKASKVFRLFASEPGIDWIFTESAPVEPKGLIGTNLQSIIQDVLDDNSQNIPHRIYSRSNTKDAELPHFTPSTFNLCFSRAFLKKLFPSLEVKEFSGLAVCDTYLNLLAAGLSVLTMIKNNAKGMLFHTSVDIAEYHHYISNLFLNYTKYTNYLFLLFTSTRLR